MIERPLVQAHQIVLPLLNRIMESLNLFVIGLNHGEFTTQSQDCDHVAALLDSF